MRRFLASLTLCLSLLCLVALPVAAQQPKSAQQDQQPQTVYVTRTGKKYHRDGCRYLAASKIAISLKDAKAKGYTACKVCHRAE
jgi:biopolymer transport protein ExbD